MAPVKGYVDVFTVDGATSKLISERIQATGLLFLEAPVSGSKNNDEQMDVTEDTKSSMKEEPDIHEMSFDEKHATVEFPEASGWTSEMEDEEISSIMEKVRLEGSSLGTAEEVDAAAAAAANDEVNNNRSDNFETLSQATESVDTSYVDDLSSEQSWSLRSLTDSSVACVTSDFAMQNVILQIGLRLLAPGGMQILKLHRFTEFGGPIFQRPVQDLTFSITKFIQRGGSFVNYYMVCLGSLNTAI